MTILAQKKLATALLQTNITLLKEAIAEGAEINAPILSNTPALVVLAESVVSGYPENLPLFQELLAQPSINVNQADDSGYTALHWAASADQIDMVKSLLDRGANPLQLDLHGRTPLAQTSPSVSRTLLEKASGTEFVPYARTGMKM